MTKLYLNFSNGQGSVDKHPAYSEINFRVLSIRGVCPEDTGTLDLYRLIDDLISLYDNARDYYENNRLTMLLSEFGINLYILREEYPELFKYEHQQIKQMGN